MNNDEITGKTFNTAVQKVKNAANALKKNFPEVASALSSVRTADIGLESIPSGVGQGCWIVATLNGVVLHKEHLPSEECSDA